MQSLLTQRQCAEMLALSERTLERLRQSGLGPRFPAHTPLCPLSARGRSVVACVEDCQINK